MKKLFASAIIGLLCFVALGCSSKGSDRVVTVKPKYPPMTLEGLSKEADMIIEGVVVSKGPGQTTRIPSTSGKSEVEYPETPVRIKVTDGIKGAKPGEEVTYWEPGVEQKGKEGNQPSDIEGHKLQQGDKVLIFLNRDGFGWGPHQTVYLINGSQAVPAKGQPEDLQALKDKIRSFAQMRQ